MSTGIQNLLQGAMRAAEGGKMEQAVTACQTVLARAPDQHDAHQLLGLIAFERGDMKEAEDRLRRSLAVEPRQPHVWNNLGNVLCRGTGWREAGACYEKAVRLAPKYLDGWLNYGRYLERSGDLEAALNAIDKALPAQPGHTKALSEKGRLLNALERPEDARPLLEALVTSRAEYVEAVHNLGVCYRQLGLPEKAVAAHRRAIALRGGVSEMHYGLGNALYDGGRIDEALAAYETAADLRPESLEAHETLNKLLWELGRTDTFGASLIKAIRRAPASATLPALYARLLLQAGDRDRAADIVNAALSRVGPDPHLQTFKARIEAGNGNSAAAADLFEAAIRTAPEDTGYRLDYVRLLIKTGAYEEACGHLEILRRQVPLDQQVLAYLGLCWRLMGDPRALWLNDYERFVKPVFLPVPDGYADRPTFNAALRQVLTDLHVSKVHPVDQTLRGGTQTKGRLFAHAMPEIQSLKRAFEDVIGDYIAGLPDDPDHPFLSRKTGTVRFSGSWSVRLNGEGFHVNHVHARGWLSSAYYVSLPERVKSGNDAEGWLKFGETGLALGDREQIARQIEPQEGLLVLFPSYMFYGTVPFRRPEERMTVAFDLVPSEPLS